MGSLPVAHPSPPPGLKLSQRGIAILLVLAALVALLVVFGFFAWPSGPAGPPALVTAGAVDDFQVGQPVRLAEHQFWLVRLDSGEFLALYEKDPHLGCTVPFRPEFEFMGRKGWFRNPCHAETYDLTGRCFAGPCPRGLDRFPVRIANGKVIVDTQVLIPGPPPNPADEPLTPSAHSRGR